MPDPSASHVVLIPTFNTGAILADTVRGALEHWSPVWVVVDGSDDGSDAGLEALSQSPGDLRVFRLPENSGKGAAVLHGASAALREQFTHIVTMDADGQHPAARIPEFVATSGAAPGALVLGRPVFDSDAPTARVWGRKLSNFWVDVETLAAGVGDSLFGMRVYPVEPLVRLMRRTRWARRFDFDPEMAVRLVWDGARPVNIATPVRYLSPDEGGVSHFRYLRDNTLLTWMHLRLFAGSILRLPVQAVRLLRRAAGKPVKQNPPSELARRISARFRSPYHRGYSRAKLGTDPLYAGVHGALEGSRLPLLDVGCGLGLLAFYLRERGYAGPVSGIDCDAEKIRAAQEVAEVYAAPGSFQFEARDARGGIPDGFEGNVTVLDVLQFLDPGAQRELLSAAAAAVAPGGALVIRSGLEDSSRRFSITRAADRLSRLVRWMPAAPVAYPTAGFLEELARGAGLEGCVKPWWGRTPFNNYLAVFRRPAPGGTAQR